jgi:hypothetical protein
MMMMIMIIITIFKEIGLKLDNEHWYDHVSTSVENVVKVRLTYYGAI